MECNIAKLNFLFVGFKLTGLFSEYSNLIPQGLREIKQKDHLINDRLDKTVILYEPCKGEDHKIGFFYIGYIITKEQSLLSEELEVIRINGNYVFSTGIIDQMADIYSNINSWISENGYKPIWPDTLYIEIYEKPLESEITWKEAVQVYLPIVD
ncbi:GyrI-like domain-containing protein [Cohnella herbarum]|uniref:GyrI-like domain-containing protein n=1 Tax=Cohnella herbarum TaxID=2728023 RepID=A0A7Z2VI05_9BACL|nr:GyrI-like domain-containing protein [Cohnella herbarum]QJD83234.1 hypothetical protein HH215_08665 [Cohnella herbarum]